MSEVAEVKVRRIGSSLGILIPKRLIEKEHLKEGSMVDISILKNDRRKLLEKYLGIAKGAKPFVREYEPDRV